MPFAVPNFVKTCMEAELNYFLSFCMPAYKGWIALWDISFRAGVGSMKEWSWKLQQDGSWVLALGRERRMLKNVPAGWNRCDVPWHASWTNQGFVSLPRQWFLESYKWQTVFKVSGRVKQQKLPARLLYQEPAPAPFPGAPLHQQCIEALFVCSKEQAAHCWSVNFTDCWDCQQGTRDVKILKHKGNGRTTIKKQ